MATVYVTLTTVAGQLRLAIEDMSMKRRRLAVAVLDLAGAEQLARVLDRWVWDHDPAYREPE